MGVFDDGNQHEQVVFCHDEATGLKAIIAIYSTALGPALGGTRFYPYGGEQAALTDVLNLSRAMAYKAACAGLDLGGGKAVIIGDPTKDKTESLLRAYGRCVESLGGRYYTACDSGTDVGDMDTVGRETRYVTGRSETDGGAGDSSVLTAVGVFQSMRAAAEHTWGSPTLAGRRVAVLGVGKVGAQLTDLLSADGASVIIADTSQSAVDHVRRTHPSVETVEPGEILDHEMDVFAPCALDGVLDGSAIGRLRARVVCGAANNQLADPSLIQRLHAAGVLYVPDYVVNAGGLIQVADELRGYSEPRARQRTTSLFESVQLLLRRAEQLEVPPAVAANTVAEERMTRTGRLRSHWLPAQNYAANRVPV